MQYTWIKISTWNIVTIFDLGNDDLYIFYHILRFYIHINMTITIR